MRERTGFTLIELTVVMLILGIVTAVVAVSLRSPYEAARMEEALARIAVADRFVRDYARRTGQPTEMRIDLARARLEIVQTATGNPIGNPTTLQGIRIDRVFTDERRLDYGDVSLRCTAEGRLPTYGVRLRTRGGLKRWILLVGLTGQVIETEHDAEVQDALGLLAAQRINAD